METQMRDMLATHKRLDVQPLETREAIRKAAAATFEALPALLLAAALLMPALAAFAGRLAERAAEDATPAAAPVVTETGRAIADQGNRALIEIRDESRESLRQNLTLPKLS
jgi:hypothetical protein